MHTFRVTCALLFNLLYARTPEYNVYAHVCRYQEAGSLGVTDGCELAGVGPLLRTANVL